MAEHYFIMENFLNETRNLGMRSSKSLGTSIPTAKKIAQLCEKHPGISKSEIARQLQIVPSVVTEHVNRHIELQKYFPKVRSSKR